MQVSDDARHMMESMFRGRTLYAALAIATWEGETMEWLPYDAEDARAQPSTAEDRPDMRWLATCMQTLFLTTPLSQPVTTSITVSADTAVPQSTASEPSGQVTPEDVVE